MRSIYNPQTTSEFFKHGIIESSSIVRYNSIILAKSVDDCLPDEAYRFLFLIVASGTVLAYLVK